MTLRYTEQMPPMALSDYSTRFLAALVAALPEFGPLVGPGSDPGCFAVSLETPSGLTFSVRTEEEDRVTVGLDVHHVHFGGWANSVDARDFDDAIDYIRKLMGRQYEVAVWTRQGEFAGSVTVERGQSPRRPDGDDLSLALKRW